MEQGACYIKSVNIFTSCIAFLRRSNNLKNREVDGSNQSKFSDLTLYFLLGPLPKRDLKQASQAFLNRKGNLGNKAFSLTYIQATSRPWTTKTNPTIPPLTSNFPNYLPFTHARSICYTEVLQNSNSGFKTPIWVNPILLWGPSLIKPSKL